LDYLDTDPARTITLRSLGDGRWRLTPQPARDLRRTFLDTFDWSIYRAGASLQWGRTGARQGLVWSSLPPGDEQLCQPLPAAPGFAADLPPGALRDRLTAITHRRRLLPVTAVATRLHPRLVQDADGRTVARLRLAQARFEDPGGGAGELHARLSLVPVRGCEDQCEALSAALAETLDLTRADAPLLLEALAAAGRRPADYSAKIEHRLNPVARADTVAKEILRALFATLEANRAGVRANLDTEFLHDLRVATRRTRSALGQFRGILPKATVAHFKTEFAWLQEVTGPVRDLDVYLLEFDACQQALPPALRDDLEPLRAVLRSHYAALQQGLVAALDSARFARLTADWRAFLEAPVPALVPDAARPPKGAHPIKSVADRRLRALGKRVRREGRRIRPDSPPADLHALRKRCKKLRYLMEFFQSLYPKEQIRPLIGHLKVVLDNLGGFQDRAVQADHLRDLARRMRDENQAASDTLLAVGAVVGNLLARQQQSRDEFAQLFSAFLDEQRQPGIANLFGSDATG